MRQIVDAPINQIASNPYRRLHTYPYIESKLDALDRSIAEVGLWPSIIARPLGDHRLWKYEIAFGHHRLETAKRRDLKEIPLILADLSNKEMLQYMGRENLEDYNASFLIQLESWEAAVKSGLVSATIGKSHQPIEIAKLLGWTDSHSKHGSQQLNATAMACHAAYALIEGGHMAREDFAELTVAAVRDIAGRALSRMEQIEKVAANSKRPVREVEHAKQSYGRAAVETARQARTGGVAQRDLRSRVDFNAMARAPADRASPLFAVFANAVADNLRRTINTDSDAEKLANIERVLEQITLVEDAAALRRLRVELVNLSERAQAWDRRLEPSKEKVVQLRALESGRPAQ